MGVDLAADGGQSGLRMAVASAQDGRGMLGPPVQVPGFAWSAAVDQRTAQQDAIVRAWHELGRPAPVGTLACGLSGLDTAAATVPGLLADLADRLDARRLVLVGDDISTHAGALGGRPGVVLNAGTGVICTSLRPEAERLRVDGWGYLLGDAGGGSWLGREGLRAALAGLDGRHAATALTDRAVGRHGDLRDFVHRVLASPTMVSDIAAFARDVIDCAADGDEVAAALCDRAADELVATATATVRRAYPHAEAAGVPFTWTGSVLTTTDVVRARFLARLPGACQAAAVTEPVGGGLDGAALLATSEGTIHHAHCREWRR